MDKLLVISSYPPLGQIHYNKTVGVGSYAKNTLRGIRKASKVLDILVLGDKHEGETDSYLEDEIKVKSVWKRETFGTFPKLFLAVLKNFSYKNILVEFEVSIFGDPLKTAPLPFLNLILRLLGKKVTTVIHQAIIDMGEFEGHTNIKGFRSTLLSLGVKLFYSFLITSSTNVVVFEDSLKRRLGNKAKIKVIPHGIQALKPVSKSVARKELRIDEGKKVILVFGYLAWYKGTDWIIDAFKELQNGNGFGDFQLVIAGGPNPNRMDKKFYREYVKEIVQNCKKNNILYTGFVSENKIASYFSASNIVLLPYRAFMSASGPLSFAYSFNKPVFVSSKLESIFQTRDINDLMNRLNLNKSDLIFDLSQDSIKSLLQKTKDSNFLIKIAKLSGEISKKRGFDQIGKEYLEVIFNK